MKFGVTAEEKELIMVICHYGIITGFLYSENFLNQVMEVIKENYKNSYFEVSDFCEAATAKWTGWRVTVCCVLVLTNYCPVRCA